MDKAKVSVIMGVYNSNTAHLSKAIESILSQSFSDFEFIICDDGSTDREVRQTINKFIRKDDRVLLIESKKNAGLAAALNECLSVSKGMYIARMDDDDISKTSRLEKQVIFLDNNPNYDIVGSNISLTCNGSIWGHAKNKEIPEKKDFLFATPFTHPTVMIRKEAYTKVGGYRVSKHTRRTEDYDLFMRMLLAPT